MNIDYINKPDLSLNEYQQFVKVTFKKYPELNPMGFSKLGLSDKQILKSYGELSDEKYHRQFLECLFWIQINCEKRKSINYEHNAYSLKHFVEETVSTGHIIQGSLIVAFLYAGYTMKVLEDSFGKPTVHFNYKKIKAFDSHKNYVKVLS